jgi:hypothetical protein
MDVHLRRLVEETFCNFFLANDFAAKLRAIVNVMQRKAINDDMAAAQKELPVRSRCVSRSISFFLPKKTMD